MNAPKRALCSFRVVEEEKKFVVVDTSHHMHTSSRIIVRNTYYAHNASKKKKQQRSEQDLNLRGHCPTDALEYYYVLYTYTFKSVSLTARTSELSLAMQVLIEQLHLSPKPPNSKIRV